MFQIYSFETATISSKIQRMDILSLFHLCMYVPTCQSCCQDDHTYEKKYFQISAMNAS